MNIVHLIDCMEFMRDVPDKHYSLAIVDPPYGIGQDWKKRKNGTYFQDTTYDNKEIPSGEYFKELKRISKDQIIWGYNYYVKYLGPTNYLIIWDKVAGNTRGGVTKRPDGVNYSKAEIAYTTKKVSCNIVAIPWDGYRRGNETGVEKIHPHQKPLDLYRWTLLNYAQEGDTIFDSHVGRRLPPDAPIRHCYSVIKAYIKMIVYEYEESDGRYSRRGHMTYVRKVLQAIEHGLDVPDEVLDQRVIRVNL